MSIKIMYLVRPKILAALGTSFSKIARIGSRRHSISLASRPRHEAAHAWHSPLEMKAKDVSAAVLEPIPCISHLPPPSHPASTLYNLSYTSLTMSTSSTRTVLAFRVPLQYIYVVQLFQKRDQCPQYNLDVFHSPVQAEIKLLKVFKEMTHAEGSNFQDDKEVRKKGHVKTLDAIRGSVKAAHRK